MGEAVILSDEFKITIPSDIRDEHDWKPGQEFAFVQDGRSVVLVPVRSAKELRGIARGADPTNYRDRNDRY